MGGRFLGEELGLHLAPPIQRRRPGRRGPWGAAGGRGRSACRPSPPLRPQPRPDPQCRPQQTRLSRATLWPLRGGPRGRRFPNVDPKQIGKRSGFQGPLAALTPHPTRAPPLTSGAHSGPSATSPPVRSAGCGAWGGAPPRVKRALLTATFAPAGRRLPTTSQGQTDGQTAGTWAFWRQAQPWAGAEAQVSADRRPGAGGLPDRHPAVTEPRRCPRGPHHGPHGRPWAAEPRRARLGHSAPPLEVPKVAQGARGRGTTPAPREAPWGGGAGRLGLCDQPQVSGAPCRLRHARP